MFLRCLVAESVTFTLLGSYNPTKIEKVNLFWAIVPVWVSYNPTRIEKVKFFGARVLNLEGVCGQGSRFRPPGLGFLHCVHGVVVRVYEFKAQGLKQRVGFRRKACKTALHCKIASILLLASFELTVALRALNTSHQTTKAHI